MVFLSTAGATEDLPAPAISPSGASLRAEALALLPRDDTESLERAVRLLEEAAIAEPRLYQVRADRALIGFLRAAARRDEARLTDNEPLMQSGRELREWALDVLRPLIREHGNDPAVVRALAIYYGLEGDQAQTEKWVQQARITGNADIWIDFAELVGNVRNLPTEAATRQLATFAASHPEMLRVRVMLARAQLDLARLDNAVATLDQILMTYPGHDPAQRLKEKILSPPPVRVSVVPVPDTVPPPRTPGLLPRKRNVKEGASTRGRAASSTLP